jgi:ankyrin repeat protein
MAGADADPNELLWYRARDGNPDDVIIALTRGANPLQRSFFDDEDRTPLHAAAGEGSSFSREGGPASVRAMLASVAAKRGAENPRAGSAADVRAYSGTVLHYSVLSRNADAVSAVLEADPDLLLTNNEDETPLALAERLCGAAEGDAERQEQLSRVVDVLRAHLHPNAGVKAARAK